MKPTDPSDAHLADRAIELRALKSGVVVLLVTFAMVFYPLAAVFAVFALAYIAYKFSYYRDRIGVYDRDDRSIRHTKLELAVLAVGVVTVVSSVAVQTVFSESWTLGGFLSLPPIDLTDVDALLGDPLVPLAWAVVVAPVVAVSYAGLQFRHRLLFGLDSYGAVIRATIWEALARLPVYLLWIAVLTVRPIYEVYEPAVRLVGTAFGLPVGTTAEFATLFGGAFPLVVVAGVAVPTTVIGTYVGVQRWKYGDATIPEVFGYHGVSPPSRSSHPANLVAPVAVYLLYTLAAFGAISSLPIGDLGLALAVVTSVLVGANVLGKTTILVRSASERVADNFDAIATGFVVGVVGLGVFDLLVGSPRTFAELALTYPIVAVPLTHFANRIAGMYAVDDISDFLDRVESDPDVFDEVAVDRLFVYSRAWDDTLRATATDGLASLVHVTTYRRNDALDVFVRAVESDQEAIVHAGLRGIAAILDQDPPAETYERLIDAGCRERIADHLDGSDDVTRSLATEVAAQLFTFSLETSGPDPDSYPTASRIDRMLTVVRDDPENRSLAGAVVEYFATVWYAIGRSSDDELTPTDDGAQRLLGGLLRLSEHVDEDVRFRAIVAVTSDRAPADDERFSLAVDRLDSASDGVRYMATHVVRSSMDRRTDQIDTRRLFALLEDPSEPVRRAGAETIATFVQFAPDRAPEFLDRLVLHLQEHRDDPGLTEGSVVRALEVIDVERLLEHPNAVSAIAAYVDGVDRTVAEPGAGVLSSVVKTSPAVVRRDAVGAAIEGGLTHASPDVRLHCLEAVVAVVDDSVRAGRRFVRGLGTNLDTDGKHSGLAVVCLAEILDSFPEDGLEIIPELSNGLGNLTSVHRQTAPFVVRGSTVSEVVVDILAEVVPRDPSRGEVLIDPLTDFATSAEGATLESIFEILVELSTEFPAECRAAVGTAAAVIEGGRAGVRRDASEVLANVAAYHPEAVEPFADRLVAATDDDSPRVRAAALVALTNVCTTSPGAVESNIHRVIGLLDDDSASVRERAARLVVTIAERAPGIVDPAAETADRLRRLQRDPAVDFDSERLQDASTAIQTGVPVEESDTSEQDGAEIWTPETSDEMGASGDTNVFEPVGDEFDDEFDTSDETGETVDTSETESPVVESGEIDGSEREAESESSEDVTDLETTVEPTDRVSDSEASTDDAGDDVEGLETAIESTDETAGETEPPDESGADVEDLETTIDPGEDTSASVEDFETAIDPGETSSESDDVEAVDSLETAIEPGGDAPDDEDTTADSENVESLETAIEPGDDTTDEADSTGTSADDVDDLDTVIAPDEDGSEEERPTAGPDDVEDLETAIDPDEGQSDADDPDDETENGT